MLLILESHPVQYRVPLYRELALLKPGQFQVVYASDCSARGYLDRDFNTTVQWNGCLLEGYPNIVLHNERGEPLRGFRSLSGRGVRDFIRRAGPRAVLFSGFLYEYDWLGWWACRQLGIPIWIRQETQDLAFRRSRLKDTWRSLFYRWFYRSVDHAFYIGELNRRHYLQHGLSPDRLSRSPYSVANPLQTMSSEEKLRRRQRLRGRLGIPAVSRLIGFFGKLIPKKDPELLLKVGQLLARPASFPFHMLLVGSGPLSKRLRQISDQCAFQCHYPGFVNQADLIDYYLAADMLVLPSRRMGETWGLVVNEGLQAGCSVAVSDAVGCGPEFEHLDQFRIFPEGNAAGCAAALLELGRYARCFDWARQVMPTYSVRCAAEAIAQKMS